ncbi:MAG: fused MFS/spermidine synthase [Propionibacteriaceae bacterium]|nr:fused MFS/spermidine synthase [Propionibacteriaceae bacterium]
MIADPRLVPDRERPGAWYVRVGGADQSYVDPGDPTYLEFDYIQQLAVVADCLAAPGERLRAVHVGGGGLTLPRYIAATRPTSAQIVFEPDASLTAAVRAVAPLPKRSGVKVRPCDGRRGLAALSADYADLVVIDAFAGAQTPPELATRECFGEVARVLAADGVVAMNLTDLAPFAYGRRVVAGIAERFRAACLAVESSTLKGRRFGNLVVAAGGRVDPVRWARRAAGAPFPYRLLTGPELVRWLGGAVPWTDADAASSPLPPTGRGFRVPYNRPCPSASGRGGA